ncbi:MAG: hypothetical protein DLM57_12475 [Pseudonocardiales bacterium]|nr:MAG: hypothetical protein DLM57_12475 [Pseudonocardiales bacterium]
MPGKLRVESPEVLAKAEQLKVDLTEVRASGADDRITGDDVFRTAIAKQLGLNPAASVAEITTGVDVVLAMKKRREAAAAARAAEAELRATAQAALSTGPSSARQSVASRGPAYALNPLVDQVRAQVSAGEVRAPTTSAPTLFAAGGDLPPFTASGIPVDTLRQVPWQARHALAAAPTMADAYQVLQDCTAGADGESGEAIASVDYGDHPGNADYQARVVAWQQSGITAEDDERAFREMPWGNRTFGELEDGVTPGRG